VTNLKPEFATSGAMTSRTMRDKAVGEKIAVLTSRQSQWLVAGAAPMK
jgi:hypothetical protein